MLPEDEVLERLNGDGAYAKPPVHKTMTELGTVSVIPTSKNARIRTGSALAHRYAAIAACRRLGRALRNHWSDYQRLSLVDIKTHCIKLLSLDIEHRIGG